MMCSQIDPGGTSISKIENKVTRKIMVCLELDGKTWCVHDDIANDCSEGNACIILLVSNNLTSRTFLDRQ
jgi:hypothetical protein